MTHRYLKPESRALLALLAALVALGPLSVDMYIPAMPSMMTALGTDISSMHLTLSTYLAGFAIFHLVCGPLADRFGRRPVLIGGTILFVAACLGCAFSTTVEELMIYRFIQGVGACVGPTLARTVARDVFGPTRAARALSLIAMLMALAPAVAPTLGGILLLWLPWPVVFVFLAIYGTAMVALIHVFLPESLPVRQSLHPVSIARNYRTLFRDPLFLQVTLASSMIYAGLFTYLSSSSFVYINMLGVPVQYFGFIFLTSVAGYMLGSAISARLARSHPSEYTVLTGVGIAAGSMSAMLVGSTLWPMSIAALMLPMIFYSTSMGLVLPNAMAIALRPFPQIAGTASAMLGFIQMGISGLASGLIGVLLADTPEPMVYQMSAITLIAVLLSLNLYRSNKRSQP
ncbi:MAG: DHA1 family bicyclomycin/chloramphenicol resistance-like MFS transporter [Bacteroidia bacterium]|jgi:DHA1 family bicyclomycin/chloramphenicol resistance-like MFS transporter